MLLVVGGGPAGVTAAVQARQPGCRGHPAGGRPGRRHQPQPGTGTRAHHGPVAHGWHETGLRGPYSASRDRLPNPTCKPSWPTAIGWLATSLRRNTWPTNCAVMGSTSSSTSVLSSSPTRTRSIAADGRSWRADRIILAVGGHASRLPIPGNELALTYSDIRTPQGSARGNGRRRRCRHGMPDRFDPRRPWQPCQPVRGGTDEIVPQADSQHLDRTRSSFQRRASTRTPIPR